MLDNEQFGKIAYDAFHEGCDEHCHFRGKYDGLADDVKKGWIDAAMASINYYKWMTESYDSFDMMRDYD